MLEQTILQGLLFNEDYCRKVVPFLKEEYFSENNHKVIFNLILHYIIKYNKIPTKEVLRIDLDKVKSLNEEQYKEVVETIESLKLNEITSLEWLLDNTEKHCQEKAVYNSIMESIHIIDGKSDKESGEIPQLLSDALAVSFDTNIGHKYLDKFEERYDYYHATENKIEFDLMMMNKITKGGLLRKTLTCLLGGTNVGKSLIMCHMAASHLAAGYNVLYITLEMSEEKIGQRIDANLMNESIDDIEDERYSKELFLRKGAQIKERMKGNLIIKEFPTSGAHTGHFRHLLTELKMKDNFIPDIIYFDYINICASSRLKLANTNSYFYIKAIAEEMRGLCIEFNMAGITATQVIRSAYSASDLDLEDVSESFALASTVDLFIGIVLTEELERLNQYMFKQMKNRYNDKTKNKRFVIGVDRARMKLYDIDNPDEDLVNDNPIMDNTEFGNRFANDTKERFNKLNFGD